MLSDLQGKSLSLAAVAALALGFPSPALGASPSPETLFTPKTRFARVGPGWRLGAIYFRQDGQAIDVRMERKGGGPPLTVRLTRRSDRRGAYCRSRSFDIVYLTRTGKRGQTDPDIHSVMTVVCDLVNKNDRGQVRLGTYDPTRMPAPKRPNKRLPILPFVVILLFGAIGFFVHRYHFLSRQHTRVERFVERNPWPFLIALCLLMLLARCVRLDLPFEGDYATQRIYSAGSSVWEILTGQYGDYRHPPLYFLALHVCLWFGHSEWLARLPALVFSLAATVGLFVFVRKHLGGVRALAATLLLGLSVPFLVYSREVADSTLFILFSVLSCHFFLNGLTDPSRKNAVAYGTAQTLMFYAYHLAILVAGAQLVCLLIHGRSRRHRDMWIAFAAALVAALPVFSLILSAATWDLSVRQVSSQFPGHVWGEHAVLPYLVQIANHLTPGGWVGIPVLLIGLFGAIRWFKTAPKNPLLHLVVILLTVSFAAAIVAVIVIRMLPYYFLFLLPFFLMLVTVAVMGPSRPDPHPSTAQTPSSAGLGRPVGHAFQWVMAALVVWVCGGAMLRHGPRLYQTRDRDQYRQVGAYLKRQKPPTTVVADPHPMYFILMYYLFPRPVETFHGCMRVGPHPPACTRQGMALATLTRTDKMKKGWEKESVKRLQSMRNRPLWFVYAEVFKNPSLLEYLETHCTKRFKRKPLTVYRCLPLHPPAR